MILVACNPVKKPGPWAVAHSRVVTPSPAIPFRNLTNCAAQPFRLAAKGLEMSRNRSKSKVDRTMPMVHPNAAALHSRDHAHGYREGRSHT